MKYNYIFKGALPLVAGVLATSCTFEQDDYFDESASLRIEHTNQQIQKYLSDAGNNGWLIQYFVAGTDEMDFEGFNLFGRFTETGMVTLSSDHRYLRGGNAGKYTEHTSVYEMLREESCVLSFSTWNNILSVFVDPVNPSSAPGALIDDGEGMHGDDRLVMLSYGPDEMLFRGERHTATKAYFKKLDCSPEEYIAKVNDLKDRVANEYVTEYSLSLGDTTVYISGLNSGCFSLCDRLDDPLQSYTRSCVFTPDGFFMQFPYILKGDSLQNFKLNSDATALVCGEAQVRPEWTRRAAKSITGNSRATFTSEGASDSFASLYNSLAAAITEAFPTQTLTDISFGTSNESASNRRTGVVFTMKTSKQTYKVAFTSTVTVSGDEVTVKVNAEDPSGNFSNYEKKGLGPKFVEIAKILDGKYRIVPDNIFRPLSATWTKADDANFKFISTL